MYDSARTNYYTFDLDKAKSLLQQANVGNFSMDMRASSVPPLRLTIQRTRSAPGLARATSSDAFAGSTPVTSTPRADRCCIP